MAANLNNLGYARVFRDPGTGDLIVDTDSLRRPSIPGVDFGEEIDGDDDDEDDEDDDDPDAYEGEFDGDFGDEVEGDDEVGDDFGAEGRKRRRRLKKKLSRLNSRESRVQQKLSSPRHHHHKGKKTVHWGMTAISGTDTLTAAGAASVKIRLQHNFRAQDITFTGSAAGAKVTSIFFGDRVVWSSSDGIDVTVFSSTSFLRGLLKGQSLKAGLDITVNGTLTGAGDFAVTLVGQKPVTPHC
jgi:hypothetical protein